MNKTANEFDNSEVGKLLLQEIRKKQQGEVAEGQLKQHLLSRVLEAQLNVQHDSPQKVLDNPYFAGMTLKEKVQFINDNKDRLKQAPKFQLGKVLKDGAMSGAYAAMGTLGHQFMTRTPGAAVIKPWQLGFATAMGLGVGAAIGATKAIADYKRDTNTQQSVDDAITALVNRSMMVAPTRTDYIKRIENTIDDFPVNYGKTLNTIDFDSLDPPRNKE